MKSSPTSPFVYVGPAGSGLGFRMAGIDVEICSEGEKLIPLLRAMKEDDFYKIIFVDEGLAEHVLPDLEKLNRDALPAIVLLANPINPRHISKEKMNRLIIKALGSDILNKS